LLLGANQPQRTEQVLRPNLVLYQRIPEAARYEAVASAMLPQPDNEQGMVPQAPNIETLLAWSRLRLGEALLKLGRTNEAAGEFQWVMDFERRKPAVLDVGSMIREPAALASIDMLKVVAAKGDVEAAWLALQQVGYPKNLPPQEQAELQRLRQQIEDARKKKQELEYWQGMNMNPVDARRQQLLSQRAEFVRQRQAYEQTLNNPQSSDREKQVARQIMQQMDLAINNLDQGMKQLGGMNVSGDAVSDPSRFGNPRSSADLSARNQQYIQQIQQQISALQIRLNNPDLDDRQKQSLQRQIDSLKQRLDQVQQSK
jgi:hypothetical protein